MPSYFLAIPGESFESELRPSLAASRRQHSFQPLQPLCAQLLSRAESGGISEAGQLLQAVLNGAGFDRNLWRALTADLLLLSAAETPEIRLAPASLGLLLGILDAGQRERIHFTPLEQMLFGSRDLTFGPFCYRPLDVGLNEFADVRRLLDWLQSVDPSSWQAESLGGLADLADEEEREEELAFAREGLAALREFYRRSAEAGCIIVCEPVAS